MKKIIQILILLSLSNVYLNAGENFINKENEYSVKQKQIKLLKEKIEMTKFNNDKNKMLRKLEFKVRVAILEMDCISKSHNLYSFNKCSSNFAKRTIQALKDTEELDFNTSDYDLEKVRWKNKCLDLINN